MSKVADLLGYCRQKSLYPWYAEKVIALCAVARHVWCVPAMYGVFTFARVRGPPPAVTMTTVEVCQSHTTPSRPQTTMSEDGEAKSPLTSQTPGYHASSELMKSAGSMSSADAYQKSYFSGGK